MTPCYPRRRFPRLYCRFYYLAPFYHRHLPRLYCRFYYLTFFLPTPLPRLCFTWLRFTPAAYHAYIVDFITRLPFYHPCLPRLYYRFVLPGSVLPPPLSTPTLDILLASFLSTTPAYHAFIIDLFYLAPF